MGMGAKAYDQCVRESWGRHILWGVASALNVVGLNRGPPFDNDHHRTAYLMAYAMQELDERPERASPVWDIETGLFYHPFDVALVEFTRAIDAYQKSKGIKVI